MGWFAATQVVSYTDGVTGNYLFIFQPNIFLLDFDCFGLISADFDFFLSQFGNLLSAFAISKLEPVQYNFGHFWV